MKDCVCGCFLVVLYPGKRRHDEEFPIVLCRNWGKDQLAYGSKSLLAVLVVSTLSSLILIYQSRVNDNQTLWFFSETSVTRAGNSIRSSGERGLPIKLVEQFTPRITANIFATPTSPAIRTLPILSYFPALLSFPAQTAELLIIFLMDYDNTYDVIVICACENNLFYFTNQTFS